MLKEDKSKGKTKVGFARAEREGNMYKRRNDYRIGVFSWEEFII
jgi:hypothetical protein